MAKKKIPAKNQQLHAEKTPKTVSEAIEKADRLRHGIVTELSVDVEFDQLVGWVRNLTAPQQALLCQTVLKEVDPAFTLAVFNNVVQHNAILVAGGEAESWARL